MDFLYDRKISLMFQGIHPLDQNPLEFLNQVVAVEVDVWAEIGGDHHHHHHHHHHGGQDKRAHHNALVILFRSCHRVTKLLTVT